MGSDIREVLLGEEDFSDAREGVVIGNPFLHAESESGQSGDGTVDHAVCYAKMRRRLWRAARSHATRPPSTFSSRPNADTSDAARARATDRVLAADHCQGHVIQQRQEPQANVLFRRA